MKITSFLKTAAATGVVLAISTLGALAVEATATVELNVRTGPGTSYGVIDTLAYGERVNTTECVSSGWCYIEQAQQNGWVSKNYLRAVPPPSAPVGGPDCELRLTLGGGSPRLEIVCASPTPPPAPTPTPSPAGDEACFYRDVNYSGPHFCFAPGRLNSLNGQFNDRISSVRLNGNVVAKLCVQNNLSGYCREIFNSSPSLGPLINDRASSLQVFPAPILGVPPVAPPVPVAPGAFSTFSTGPVLLEASYAVDFDQGTARAIWTEADVWHNGSQLQTTNGAKIALGNGRNRGFAGCWGATYSSSAVLFNDMPVGTYVCVKTNEGRISQFRVNAYVGQDLRLGYTTWRH